MTYALRSHSRTATRRVGMLVLGVLMAGCASLPEPVPEPVAPALPGGWSAYDAPPTTTGEWWRDFGDPLLDAAIAQAVGENPQVWLADAQAAQARAQAVIAGADRLPTVSGGLSADRLETAARAGGSTDGDGYGVNVNVSWELDLWGRLAALSEAARENYLSSAESLRGVRQSIAAQTAKAYVAVVAARQQTALSSQTLEVFDETARQVGNRADVGVGSPGDKFLAIANRESAAAGLAGNEETLDRAARQLETLIADYPSGTVQTAEMLFEVPPLPAVGVPSELLARRPDISAAENSLRAAGFNVIAARRALLPAVSLTTSAGTLAPSLGEVLNGDFSFWSLAGNLLQPIFQGGRLRANVELNEARQREAANNYVLVVREALREVESALAARSAIARRYAGLCQAAEAAQSAEEISFNRYRQGVEPFLTVLESQGRALDASSACITARRAGIENHIDLMLALGGGFEDVPIAIPDPARTGLAIMREEAGQIFLNE